jgi:protein-export membrane protein SecD
MAIVMGDRVLVAPAVEGPIAASGRIIGNFDVEEARRLVRALQAGTLPAELTLASETWVGPTLGADTIRSGLAACAGGVVLVVGFLLWMYRADGAVATAAITLNVLIQIAILALLKATLTLPGIAGLALTIGMAVDAHVLVFERVREELALGRTARAALRAAYDRVFTTLIDSHVTTLLTGAALYWAGTGAIRGFAVALIVGLIVNLFTATWVARNMQEALV